ncbi:MAG: PD-(D/E)XK nuclease family transposase, partial [Bacteroides sp.]|nr:PD-(D/E)XK nuclease family transposase [Bacteroides sp.]
FECWIYNLVNMNKLEKISFKDQKAIFDRLEKIASQANLTKEERAQYEYEWKIYNDYFNVMESAEKKAQEKGLAKGLAEGLEKGLAEGLERGLEKGLAISAQNLKALGVSTDIIMKATGLSLEEINNL